MRSFPGRRRFRLWPAVLVISLLWWTAAANSANDQIVLRLNPGGILDVHSTLGLPVSGTYPEYTILCSTNLQTWTPCTEAVTGSAGVSDELLRLNVPLAGGQAWYRVVANVKLGADGPVGDTIYGYGTAFSRELQKLGQLPLSDFISKYSLTNSFLAGVSFDPTTAEYWALFNLDPAVNNATNPAHLRMHDFRLNINELNLYRTNGFVVSQRMDTNSFAEQFYRIFNDDLPVFFSADAALHAWHRS